MARKKTRPWHSAGAKYINKWLAVLAIAMALGGVFAFGFLAYLANVIQGNAAGYEPVWMIGMIPFMLVVATPITVFIAKVVYKHLDTLSRAMHDVSDGKTDIYIPTAKAGVFTELYENFNTMTAEIISVKSLRNEMVDGFSHELKTPVASINGFAKLLLEENLTEEKRRTDLGIIVKESDRLAALSKNALFLSKIDTTEIIADKKPYDLAAQIKDIIIGQELSWSEKNINIGAELPDTVYNGNADLMESLFSNLISNAIKFTPKNGDITVTLKTGAGEIVFSVADTGVGMSKDAMEHIFERYYQGDASRNAGGHGLGLAIVKRLVTLCGGTVTAESREGEGSTFIVRLPISL
jgi:signal transduction histidine kinase